MRIFLLLPFLLLTIRLSTAGDKFSSASEARAAADSALHTYNSTRDTTLPSIRQQLGQARANLDQVTHSADDQINEAFRKVQDLDSQLYAFNLKAASEMEEMRSGEFCSGCGRTRSDILSHGEQFPHPGQHVVPATPEQLQQKQQELDEQRKQLTDELSNAQASLQEARTQRDQQIANANKQVNDAEKELADAQMDMEHQYEEYSSDMSEASSLESQEFREKMMAENEARENERREKEEQEQAIRKAQEEQREAYYQVLQEKNEARREEILQEEYARNWYQPEPEAPSAPSVTSAPSPVAGPAPNNNQTPETNSPSGISPASSPEMTGPTSAPAQQEGLENKPALAPDLGNPSLVPAETPARPLAKTSDDGEATPAVAPSETVPVTASIPEEKEPTLTDLSNERDKESDSALARLSPIDSPSSADAVAPDWENKTDQTTDALRNSLSEVASQGKDFLQDQGREVAKEAVNGISEGLEKPFVDALKQAAPDLLEEGPKTPQMWIDKAVEDTVRPQLKELAEKTTGLNDEDDGLANYPLTNLTSVVGNFMQEAAINHVVEVIKQQAQQTVQTVVIDPISDALGLTTPPDPQLPDRVNQAQADFEHSVSPVNLLYRTGFGIGPNAQRGLHGYFTDMVNKFKTFFDIATSNDATNESQ